MDRLSVTTPFGRRPMSLALVKGQIRSSGDQSRKNRSTSGRCFATYARRRMLLGVQDRALAVLNALLSFYPQSELAGSKTSSYFRQTPS